MNCAAFPETLIEAELFGHERGAFTGAVRKREGRFKAADGGTLLLDEVAEIPLPVQAKLLRVLEEGVIEPLGTNTSVPVNVRIVSATHRDLKELIAQGKFREDLYFRINVLDLNIPPLRERRADLPLLMAHFLRRFYPGRVPPGIAPRAWAALMDYPFPGNVREFAHAIERAVVLAHGSEIDLEHLPADIAGAAAAVVADARRTSARSASLVKEFEKQYILRALRLASGGKGHAAELLGISRKNLWEKLKLHGIGDDATARLTDSRARSAEASLGPSFGTQSVNVVSLVGSRLDDEPTAVRGEEAARDRETEARADAARALRVPVPIVEVPANLGRQAGAAIGHGERRRRRRGARPRASRCCPRARA